MPTEKTCFVISPIGGDSSPTRQAADDLYDLLIEPALQVFHFRLVRADRIPRPSVITSDIIQLVQTADLCLIDLTDHNPNVFYECGRRHETGRPFIQLIRKDDTIPFDLSGIRTIQYDLTDPRTIRSGVKDIQAFVSELERSGYGEGSSGESLSTIASTLERIERKVNTIASLATPVGAMTTGSIGDPLEVALQRPQDAFMQSLLGGDISTAASLLSRIEQRIGQTPELLMFATLVARAGDPRGADVLSRMLDTALDKGDLEAIRRSIGGLVQYYVAIDSEKEALSKLEPIITKLLKRQGLESEYKAFLLNQLGMLHFGAGSIEPALALTEQVIALNPDAPSYHYNASMIYEALDLRAKAAEAMDRCLERDIPEPDADHLRQAVEVFVKVGRARDARTVFEQLKSVDPTKARMLLVNDQIRRVIQAP